MKKILALSACALFAASAFATEYVPYPAGQQDEMKKVLRDAYYSATKHFICYGGKKMPQSQAKRFVSQIIHGDLSQPETVVSQDLSGKNTLMVTFATADENSQKYMLVTTTNDRKEISELKYIYKSVGMETENKGDLIHPRFEQVQKVYERMMTCRRSSTNSY